MERFEVICLMAQALITEPVWGEDSSPVYRILTQDVDDELTPFEQQLAVAACRLADAIIAEAENPSFPARSEETTVQSVVPLETPPVEVPLEASSIKTPHEAEEPDLQMIGESSLALARWPFPQE